MRIVLLALVLFVCHGFSQSSARSRAAAYKAWDRVITAKGGRQKLARITTFGFQSIQSKQVYQRKIFRFPDKVWMRTSDRDPIGLMVQAIDDQRGTGLFPEGVETVRVPGASINLASKYYCDAVEMFLLENGSLKPEILAVDEGQWKDRDVEIIYARMCGGFGAYLIDLKSNLPVAYVVFKINTQDKLSPPLSDVTLSWNFSDYLAIDGVMMPMKTSFGRMSYEFNRDYPDSLFDTRPSFSDWGPWPPPVDEVRNPEKN